eukprot:579499_1
MSSIAFGIWIWYQLFQGPIIFATYKAYNYTYDHWKQKVFHLCHVLIFNCLGAYMATKDKHPIVNEFILIPWFIAGISTSQHFNTYEIVITGTKFFQSRWINSWHTCTVAMHINSHTEFNFAQNLSKTKYKWIPDLQSLNIWIYKDLECIFMSLMITYQAAALDPIVQILYGCNVSVTPNHHFSCFATSPRNFWKHQSRAHRICLKRAIHDPLYAKYKKRSIAILGLFVVNWFNHCCLSFLYCGSFGVVPWSLSFIVMGCAVAGQIVLDKWLKDNKLQYVKDSWMYKIFWFVVLHAVMSFTCWLC